MSEDGDDTMLARGIVCKDRKGSGVDVRKVTCIWVICLCKLEMISVFAAGFFPIPLFLFSSFPLFSIRNTKTGLRQGVHKS